MEEHLYMMMMWREENRHVHRLHVWSVQVAHTHLRPCPHHLTARASPKSLTVKSTSVSERLSNRTVRYDGVS